MLECCSVKDEMSLMREMLDVLTPGGTMRGHVPIGLFG